MDLIGICSNLLEHRYGKFIMDTLHALNQVSNGRRDYVTTEEFAESITRSTNTLRKNHCLNGHCYGIRPIKVGGRLLWSVKEIAKLLNGEVKL